MIRIAVLQAVLTGVFCAVFAAVVDIVTNALDMMAVIVLAFVSGFCGSLFARFILGKKP